MQITHYVEIYPRDDEYPKFEGLCDFNNGITIICEILGKYPGKRFFIKFNDLFTNTSEILRFPKDGSCYYC
jgi:hypothetical protein